MKRRIGSLRGKPIVEGDENLITQNELHEDNLNSNDDSNSGSSSGSTVGGMRYFKLRSESNNSSIYPELLPLAIAYDGSYDNGMNIYRRGPNMNSWNDSTYLQAIATSDEYLSIYYRDYDNVETQIQKAYETIAKYCDEITKEEFETMLGEY